MIGGRACAITQVNQAACCDHHILHIFGPFALLLFFTLKK
jgi:hypothetical protein